MSGPAVQETLRNARYSDVLQASVKNPAFWEMFGYDKDGNLAYRNTKLRIVDLMKAFGDPNDAPIQITDTLRVEQRAELLKNMVADCARIAGYPDGKTQIHYATKANFKAEVVTSALRFVHMEASGALDLENYENMLNMGVISIKDGIKVICNGYKGRGPTVYDRGYATRAIDLHNRGVDITVVLEENELPFYQSHRGIQRKLDVGLRLKFGKVKNDWELDGLNSRFGFDWRDLQTEASRIDQIPHLRLTMLHAMVSASETLEPRQFVQSLLFAADKYARLKQKHPRLTHLNIGGGIPSMSSGYDYKSFFTAYFAGVKKTCERYGVEPPTIVIESGSFIADDCESLVYRVIDLKRNAGDGAPWAIINGILTNLPDIYIADESFDFIAATNGNEPTMGVRFGDITCDSFNVMPPKDQPDKHIIIPQKLEGLLVMVPTIGAYQDVISAVGDEGGARMVLHCGNPEPIQVFIGRDEKGKLYVEGGKRLPMRTLSEVAGFRQDKVHRLKLK